MLADNTLNMPHVGASEERNPAGPSRFEVLLLFLPLVRMTAFLRQNREAFTNIDTFALFDIAALFVVGFYLLCVLYKIPWRKLLGSCMGWLLFYYAFCVFSFLWRLPGSSAPYIIYRAASMNVMILYVFYVMSRFQDQKAAFDGLLRYIFVLVVLSVIGHIRASGGALHTNSYSFIAAVLAALALTAVKTGEKTVSQVKWSLFLGILGVVLGTSTGSNVAFAMALCFIFCASKKSVNLFLVLLLPLIGVFIYEFFFQELLHLLAPGKSMESIMSGTGRMRMWSVYLDAFKQSPWLGYGFCIGEKAGRFFGYRYTLSAHNGYISVLVNTGLSGAFIFGMFILSWILGILKQISLSNKYAFPVIAAFIVIMVNNMSVPTIGSQWGALSTVVLLVGSYFALFCQEVSTSALDDVVK